MEIRSQAPNLFRGRFRDYPQGVLVNALCEGEEAPRILLEREDDDIVHADMKVSGTCNRLVAGSNPVPGAVGLFAYK